MIFVLDREPGRLFGPAKALGADLAAMPQVDRLAVELAGVAELIPGEPSERLCRTAKAGRLLDPGAGGKWCRPYPMRWPEPPG